MSDSARTAVRTLLIIDDDALLCASLTDALSSSRTEVLHAQTGRDGLEICRRRAVHVVLLDQHLPDSDGVKLCAKILETNDRAKIVFMTAYPTFEHAVAALKVGASDYLSKPFDLGELQLAVANAFRVQELESIEQLYSRRRQQEVDSSLIVGADGGLAETIRLADLAAGADLPVLITGETGTGKSLLARHIHYAGPRKDQPFVSLNCAALPETLAESELFGHEKGAFTGASTTRRGVFEMAEGGTVLLDEVGAMPLNLQAKLLGVLEDRSLRRIGGEQLRRVNARIVAATNVEPERAVDRGELRRDLFYRLSVIRIHIPPLRHRPQDIPELCRHLLPTIGGREVVIDDREIARLAAYGWPGNVRELRNVLERSAIIHSDRPLAPSSLLGREVGGPDPASALDGGETLPLEVVEQRHIERVLDSCDGNYTRTAKVLGIALSTLKRKLQKYGRGD